MLPCKPPALQQLPSQLETAELVERSWSCYFLLLPLGTVSMEELLSFAAADVFAAAAFVLAAVALPRNTSVVLLAWKEFLAAKAGEPSESRLQLQVP